MTLSTVRINEYCAKMFLWKIYFASKIKSNVGIHVRCPSLQFVTVSRYNMLDGISVQKEVWAINNVPFFKVLSC
jgi:hypothetical protein